MRQDRIDEFKAKYSLYYLAHQDDISSRWQKNEVLISVFFDSFGIDKLNEMDINDYCFEKGNKSTFCYWIDNWLNDLGDIHIQHTAAFQKYHIQKINGDYRFLKKKQFKNVFGSTSEEVFNNVKQEIISVVKAAQSQNPHNISIISNSKLHESFKAKLTYVYSNNNWIPILVDSDVNKLLDWLGVGYSKRDDLTSKRVRLYKAYKEIVDSGMKMSTWEFMRFCYSDSGLRSILRVGKKDASSTKKKTKKLIIHSFKVSDITFRDLDLDDITIVNDPHSNNKRITTKEDFEMINKRKRIIGEEGEKIVYSYLKKNKSSLGISKIMTPCFHGDNYLHYDISYIADGTEHYIEVKATSSTSLNSIYFEMSKDEYKTMKGHLNDGLYEIYFVSNVFGRPVINKIKPSEILLNGLKPHSYYLKGNI